MSALNTSSSHLPTKFSQPPNLHICITSSQFSLLAALALHLWSHSLVNPHHLLYEQQIVPSSMLPLVSGTNFRLPFVNHALISPLLHQSVLSVALPPVPWTHHFHHPLPLHSFTPGLKLSFSANPSHRSLPFLLPDWLHGFPGLFTDTSEHIRFYSIVFYFVVFLFSTVVVPCCRLIWLIRPHSESHLFSLSYRLL